MMWFRCLTMRSYRVCQQCLLTLDSPDLLSRIDLDELMKKDEPPFTFPKTLEEFEYAFNECKCIFWSSNTQSTLSLWCKDTENGISKLSL